MQKPHEPNQGHVCPPGLQEGWALIARGLASGPREREAIPTAAWIAAHGRQHSFRAPSLEERSRAMGCAAYGTRLMECGLTERQLYDAQGNSFDRTAVALRIRDAVAAWRRGGAVPRHAYPSPRVVARVYEALRAHVAGMGLPALVLPQPFPADCAATILGYDDAPQDPGALETWRCAPGGTDGGGGASTLDGAAGGRPPAGGLPAAPGGGCPRAAGCGGPPDAALASLTAAGPAAATVPMAPAPGTLDNPAAEDGRGAR